jgi:hypothetical protein
MGVIPYGVLPKLVIPGKCHYEEKNDEVISKKVLRNNEIATPI